MARQKSQTFSVQYLNLLYNPQRNSVIFAVPLNFIFQVGGQLTNNHTNENNIIYANFFIQMAYYLKWNTLIYVLVVSAAGFVQLLRALYYKNGSHARYLRA